MDLKYRVLNFGHGHVALVEVALHARETLVLVKGRRIAAKHVHTETGAAKRVTVIL